MNLCDSLEKINVTVCDALLPKGTKGLYIYSKGFKYIVLDSKLTKSERTKELIRIINNINYNK